MTKVGAWWKVHEGWAAALIMAMGAFAMGYMIASIQCSHQVSDLRAHQTNEMNRMAEAYTQAMQAKDQRITDLAAKTERAASKANKAASKVIGETEHPELQEWTK